MAIDFKGLLSNPMAAYQSAKQPGGLLAPVTSMNQFLGDPRVNVGLAIARGESVGDALVQSATIQKALGPDKLSERETRLQDIMTELGVDRATAIKYDKGLITQGTTVGDKQGNPKKKKLNHMLSIFGR